MKLQANKAYVIMAQEKTLALGIENGSAENGALIKLQEASQTGADSQKWTVKYVDGEWFKLINKHSGKALDLCMLGTVNGTWVQQWESVDTDSQLWTLEETAEGSCLIRSQRAGIYLDIAMGAAVPGAQMQIWEKTGSANQVWHFSPTQLDEAVKPDEKAASEAAPRKKQPREKPLRLKKQLHLEIRKQLR